MKTTHTLLATFAATCLAASATSQDEPTVDSKPGDKNRVQIALLLDTSNSMDGLIGQAKTQLWKVVNTFIDARRDGEAPFVEVALYEYGNNRIPVGSHYVRMVQPLTRDLDEVSKQLFALTTNGGEEYCGAVIQRALTDLQWDEDPATYKAMFVAGNEPFTQGPIDARSMSREALSKKLIVNTIHCGSRDQGIRGDWHDGAALGGGEFMVIDQDRAVTHIKAPQDAMIEKLGKKLNETYIAYGTKAEEGKSKQVEADLDATVNASAGSAVQRSIAKASSNYSNTNWDLVDAVQDNSVDLAALPASALPEELRELSVEARKEKVDAASRQRVAIQDEIKKLNEQRAKFIGKEKAKLAQDGVKTLDEALVETTRGQAKKLGYKFEK